MSYCIPLREKKITVSTFILVVAWQSYPITKNKENMKISKVVHTEYQFKPLKSLLRKNT